MNPMPPGWKYLLGFALGGFAALWLSAHTGFIGYLQAVISSTPLTRMIE